MFRFSEKNTVAPLFTVCASRPLFFFLLQRLVLWFSGWSGPISSPPASALIDQPAAATAAAATALPGALYFIKNTLPSRSTHSATQPLCFTCDHNMCACLRDSVCVCVCLCAFEHKHKKGAFECMSALHSLHSIFLINAKNSEGPMISYSPIELKIHKTYLCGGLS